MRICSLAPLSEAILDRVVVQLGLGIPLLAVFRRVHALGSHDLAAVDLLIADTQAKSVLETSNVLQVLDILLQSKMPLVLFSMPGLFHSLLLTSIGSNSASSVVLYKTNLTCMSFHSRQACFLFALQGSMSLL